MPLVVFDLDGTLVDSRLDLANSTNEMLASYGAPPLPVDRLTAMIGEGAMKLVARALKAADRDVPLAEALSRFRGVYDRRLLEHTTPYPGIPEVVRAASARVPLAVLTNKPEGPTRRILDAFDLAGGFSWVIGGDSGFPRKPDPAALQHLRQAAQAGASQTLVVGDSMIDLETARRGGVRFCAAQYGFGGAREPLVLTDGDLAAADPAALGGLIEDFLQQP